MTGRTDRQDSENPRLWFLRLTNVKPLRGDYGKGCRSVFHSNLRCKHLVKIMKKGSFNGKVYKAPILSKKIVYFVKCLKIKNYLRYKNLKKKDFKHSFKDIKNVKALKKAMIRRYKKSLLHINNIQIIRLGVSTTKLKIISSGPLVSYLK